MARILTSGFEAPFSPVEEGWERFAGTVNTEGTSWGGGGRPLRIIPGLGSLFGTANRAQAGEHVCRCFDSNDNLSSAFKHNVPAVSEAWGRFAWRTESGQRVGNGRFLEWYLNGIGAICSVVQKDLGSSSVVGLRFFNNGGGVLQDTDSGWVSIDTTRWVLMEWHLKLAGSNGRFEFWVDGTKVLDFTGPIAGPGGEVIFDAVIIGMGGPSAGQSFNTSSRVQYDDIAINDLTGTVNNGRIGDGVILRRVPRFPGSTTQLLSDLGGANPEVNFRRTHRDSDVNGFVGTITPGDKDLYLMSEERQGHDNDGRGTPVKEGYSPAIVLQARSVHNGPSIANIRYAVKPPSQAEFQSPAAPGLPLANAGLLTVNHQLELNPNTGDPFTHADLNGIEAGFSLET